jgi:hypothetical protein
MNSLMWWALQDSNLRPRACEASPDPRRPRKVVTFLTELFLFVADRVES